jgi:very-short-patch-repair endonuclease
MLPYNKKLTPNARSLRKEMTPQERRLWYDFLRNYPVKFYRQRVIANFIVDFYCSKAKLVVELDGSQHFTADAQIYDKERTEILESLDLKVIRFSNAEVDENFNGVCTIIIETLATRIQV